MLFYLSKLYIQVYEAPQTPLQDINHCRKPKVLSEDRSSKSNEICKFITSLRVALRQTFQNKILF